MLGFWYWVFIFLYFYIFEIKLEKNEINIIFFIWWWLIWLVNSCFVFVIVFIIGVGYINCNSIVMGWVKIFMVYYS